MNDFDFRERFEIAISRRFPGEKLVGGDPRWNDLNGSFYNETYNIHTLAEEIEQGHAFCPKLRNGWRKADNFVSAQYLALDIDELEPNTTIESFLQTEADDLINNHATLLYYTHSHKPEAPRIRVMFLLDRPITDKNEYRKLSTGLINRYQFADQNCKDACRFFYGSLDCESLILDQYLPYEVASNELLDQNQNNQTAVSQIKPTPPIADTIPEGERNTTLTSHAGSMQRRNMGKEAIKAALSAFNKERCNPPLENAEVDGIVNSISKYPPAEFDFDGSLNQEEADLNKEGGQSSGSTWADIDSLIGPVTWDWQNWLVRSMLIFLVSDPGVGKSYLMLRIAASYILGLPWPDGTTFNGKKGKVVWCEAEAAQGFNKERAKALGLPLDHLLTPLDDPLMNIQLDKAEHRQALWNMAHRPDVQIIIVDSFRGSHSKDENSSETMGLVKWLAELAQSSGKPVLVTHHLRKRGRFDSGSPKLYDVRGSTAIVQPARMVWLLDIPDSLNQEHIRLSVIKSNLAGFPQPLSMSIDEDGVHFGDAPEQPSDDSSSDLVRNLILHSLSFGPLPSSILILKVELKGISWRTAKREIKELGIKAKKIKRTWYRYNPAMEP